MWTCPKCDRIFEKVKQSHSCRKISISQHFKNKDLARELFNFLVNQIEYKIGPCRIISLPCCIHLYGNYDFLAALPHKDKLEIRFAVQSKLDSPRLVQSVPVSIKYIKNYIDIKENEEINTELIGWLNQAYHLKDKN